MNNLKKFMKKNYFDPFSHYQVDKVMFAAGLFVDDRYRQRGIAVEMMKARVEVGKAVNVQVSSNVFSSLGARKPLKKSASRRAYNLVHGHNGRKILRLFTIV